MINYLAAFGDGICDEYSTTTRKKMQGATRQVLLCCTHIRLLANCSARLASLRKAPKKDLPRSKVKSYTPKPVMAVRRKLDIG
ncbi:MAG: hypothetical protein A2481_04160 [Candidatus Yonathbacteria bacterium RIFOXYC2_FULL_47_9]|nr:MAG: hypothetical protein A2481_04160 [Candidatus Yonathbacteria bacterium RIFOXYC2_FULL_47_9]HAT68183.1 hypothetical protein [Candidatus Yonathbacteria bacterium]